MSQTEEFMFQNVAYRLTVYRTGIRPFSSKWFYYSLFVKLIPPLCTTQYRRQLKGPSFWGSTFSLLVGPLFLQLFYLKTPLKCFWKTLAPLRIMHKASDRSGAGDNSEYSWQNSYLNNICMYLAKLWRTLIIQMDHDTYVFYGALMTRHRNCTISLPLNPLPRWHNEVKPLTYFFFHFVVLIWDLSHVKIIIFLKRWRFWDSRQSSI